MSYTKYREDWVDDDESKPADGDAFDHIEEGIQDAHDAIDAHLADTADAHDASAISILDTAGDFTATDVEGALAELQSDAEAHLADSSDAHDASAISVADAGGNFAGTDVEAVLAEIYGDLPQILGVTSITADVSTGSATEASPLDVVSLPQITFDGTTPVEIEFWCPAMGFPASGNFGVSLWDEDEDLGRLMASSVATDASSRLGGTVPLPAKHRLTPAAGAKTYRARMWRTAGTFTIKAGAGGAGTYFPAFIVCRRSLED